MIEDDQHGRHLVHDGNSCRKLSERFLLERFLLERCCNQFRNCSASGGNSNVCDKKDQRRLTRLGDIQQLTLILMSSSSSSPSPPPPSKQIDESMRRRR